MGDMRHGCPDSRSFDIHSIRELPLSEIRWFFDRTVATQAAYLHHWYPNGRFTKEWRQNFEGILTLVATEANEPVGIIRLIHSPFVEGGGEMEYLVHPEYRELGIATQLCRSIMAATDGRLVKRICPTNAASQRLARKLGFEETPRIALATRIWTLER